MDASLSDALNVLRQRVKLLRSNRIRPAAHQFATVPVEQGSLCWYCSMPSPQPNIVPLFSKLIGGINHRRNFVHACPACSLESADLDPLDWARSMGKTWSASHAAARAAAAGLGPLGSPQAKSSRRSNPHREVEDYPRVAAVIQPAGDRCLVALPQLSRRHRPPFPTAAERSLQTLWTAHGANALEPGVLLLPRATAEGSLSEGVTFGGLWVLP